MAAMSRIHVSSALRFLSSLVLVSLVVACSAGSNPGSSAGGGGGDDTSGPGGGGPGGSGGGSSSSSGSGGGGGGGGSSSSSGSGGGGGSEPVTPPYCAESCQTAVDCSQGGAGSAFDGDNYACNSGLCEYTGCSSDAECTVTFMSQDYVCKSFGAGIVTTCVKKCQVSADCSQGAAGSAFDADNYTCTNGGCEYAGCKTDAECEVTFSGQAYVCKASGALSVAVCAKSCQTAADCSQGGTGSAFDGDNYTCTSGGCEYTGCNSDGECAASFPNGTYVCSQ